MSEKKPCKACLNAEEGNPGCQKVCMQWPGVCSGMYSAQLALRGQEKRINYYLSDVYMELMSSSECYLKHLCHGLLKCLENPPLQIFTCLFAISLCSALLTQRNCEPGPLAELDLRELSALRSQIHLNIFVNFWQYFHSLLFLAFSHYCDKYEPFLIWHY